MNGAFEVVGAAGAAGVVAFSLRGFHRYVLLRAAQQANAIDFAVLGVAGACLAAYAIALHNPAFAGANAVSAAVNMSVASSAWRAARARRRGLDDPRAS